MWVMSDVCLFLFHFFHEEQHSPRQFPTFALRLPSCPEADGVTQLASPGTACCLVLFGAFRVAITTVQVAVLNIFDGLAAHALTNQSD